jgi:flagellar FliL protein
MSEKEQQPAAEAAPAQKSRAKLFIIAGVAVVLLGGGGAAAYWAFGRGEPAAEEASAEHAAPEHHRIVSFEPFVVNLADRDARRFLRISVRLVVAGEEEGGHGSNDDEVTLVRLRSEILDQLTQQTADTIVTAEGKAALKKAIAARAAAILEPMEVADVLFSDFVVQY